MHQNEAEPSERAIGRRSSPVSVAALDGLTYGGIMVAQPIENHGVIGDLHTAALVGMDGSIDFMCFPRFDSPSLFAALLDPGKGGQFQIAPVQAEIFRRKQLYFPDTNVLLTRFLANDGVAEISDFMPIKHLGHRHDLVRRVKVVRGELLLRMVCAPRFDYGRAEHTAEKRKDEVLFASKGEDRTAVRLRTSVPVQIRNGDAVAEFKLRAGESASFILEEVVEGEESPSAQADYTSESFKETMNFWLQWIGALQISRALARDGQPRGADAQAADFAALRLHRGRADLRPARGDRRQAQLGLSLHLDSRRVLHALCLDAPGLHGGGRSLHALDRGPVPRKDPFRPLASGVRAGRRHPPAGNGAEPSRRATNTPSR